MGWSTSKMGDGWKNKRLQLYNKRNEAGGRPLDDLIADVPGGIPEDAWERYVRWRRGAVGQKRSQLGQRSRSFQKVHHTAGTKSFAVGYKEMENEAKKKGTKATLGLFYRIKHRHADGSPTSMEAEEQIARIEEVEREIDESQGDNVDPTASLRAALGPREHPGRVRGMGFGARPSQVYGRASDPGSAQSTSAPGPASCSGSMRTDEYEDQLRRRITQEVTETLTEQFYGGLDSWIQNTNSMLMQLQESLNPGGPRIEVPPLPPRPPKYPRNRSPDQPPDQQPDRDDQPPAA